MRPIPALVLLSAVAIGGLAAGALTSRPIFFLVALGAATLLGTSLSTSRRPLTRALDGFRHHAVEVRLWGVPPPDLVGATLVVTAVNALGAGAHVFFDVQGGGSRHLKVAQPKESILGVDRVVIGGAKYVQWNGERVPRAGGAPAVTITLCDAPVPAGAGSIPR